MKIKNKLSLLFRRPFNINLARNLKHHYALKYKNTEDERYYLKAKKEKDKQIDLTIKFIAKHYFSYLKEKEISPLNDIDNKIYVIYLQGEDKMPALSKFSYSKIKEHALKKEVKLVTLDNLSDFGINLPPFILDDLNKGKISYTNLADLIRIMLLSRNSGLYLDLTIYPIKDIDESFFESDFISIKADDIYRNKFNQVNYDTFPFGQVYLLGGKDKRVFKIVESILLAQLEKYHKYPFYEFIYYVFHFIYLNDIEFKKEVDNMKINNSDCELLANYLDENDNLNLAFDYKIKEDTTFIKLSNKATYSKDYMKVVSQIDKHL